MCVSQSMMKTSALVEVWNNCHMCLHRYSYCEMVFPRYLNVFQRWVLPKCLQKCHLQIQRYSVDLLNQVLRCSEWCLWLHLVHNSSRTGPLCVDDILCVLPVSPFSLLTNEQVGKLSRFVTQRMHLETKCFNFKMEMH